MENEFKIAPKCGICRGKRRLGDQLTNHTAVHL